MREIHAINLNAPHAFSHANLQWLNIRLGLNTAFKTSRGQFINLYIREVIYSDFDVDYDFRKD